MFICIGYNHASEEDPREILSGPIPDPLDAIDHAVKQAPFYDLVRVFEGKQSIGFAAVPPDSQRARWHQTRKM